VLRGKSFGFAKFKLGRGELAIRPDRCVAMRKGALAKKERRSSGKNNSLRKKGESRAHARTRFQRKSEHLGKRVFVTHKQIHHVKRRDRKDAHDAAKNAGAEHANYAEAKNCLRKGGVWGRIRSPTRVKKGKEQNRCRERLPRIIPFL